MSRSSVRIEADTKVAQLLDDHPELEDVLIAMAPPFQKLRNPILRKSVARVASLRQAAAVAGLPVTEVVNALRAAVGEEAMEAESIPAETSYFGERPAWFDFESVVLSIDEQTLDPDTMPLTVVMEAARKLQPGQILTLVTSYVPAPGIDILKKKGYLVWSVREGAERVKTHISAP
jgi:hypothetical protein